MPRTLIRGQAASTEGRPQRGERPEPDGSKLNELADQFDAGELVLDDTLLQDRFDALVERIVSAEPDPDKLEERGLTREVTQTDDSITVTISGAQGSRTVTFTLDLEADTLTKSVSSIGAEGESASRVTVHSYDEDSLLSFTSGTRRDGTSFERARDIDLDDRLLTLTVDDETVTVPFDEIGSLPELLGVPPREDAPPSLDG